jgi:hypothetical protein
MFNGETTIDTLGEDIVWQEEELEFEDVEEPGEDKTEQAQGWLEELRVQPESKWPAHYVGNLKCLKCRRQQK